MELTKEILENLQTLDLVAEPGEPEFLKQSAINLGYESLKHKVKYKDNSEGLIVQMGEQARKYNNGVYILRHLKDKDGKGSLVLEIVVPNSKSKQNLITRKVDQINTFLDELDTSDLQVYDYAEVLGYVINDWVVKPLAKSLFPGDSELSKLKRTRFSMLYLSRFMYHSAMINAGTKVINEELVNAEPFTIKQMIEHQTKEKNNKDIAYENKKLKAEMTNMTRNEQDKSVNKKD